jgi:Cu2+-containing amine oxidase
MSTRHPLDPLTAEEIRTAVAIVRSERGVTERWRFASIHLKEPSKQALAGVTDAGAGDASPPREAQVVCWNRDDGAAYKGIVSLADERLISWETLLLGEHPPITPDEFHECDAALRHDPRVIEALNNRGVTDMDLVLFDTWAYGAELVPDRYRGRRIAWVDVWHRSSADANPYASALSGLHPIVDLNTMELLELEDHDPGPAPKIMGEYAPGLVPNLEPRADVKPLGIMVTTPFASDQPPYGTLIDNRTYAPFHQHFIVARLDLDVDVDGESNTVYCTESAPLPSGPDDPYGIALTQRATPLRTEREGRQDYDWRCQRGWKVLNDNVANGLGTPVGYKLEPGAAIPALLEPDSPVLRRARAIEHTLWVTPYSADERWPCGEFPNLSAEDSGLPTWTARDRPIENADVVLWYVFGINHVTGPEDWPVMPVDTVAFWLKPFGFFDRNPALDVPGHDPAHPDV